MSTPIEARLRITADTAQASAAVDQLGKKTLGVSTDGLKAAAKDTEKAHDTAQGAVRRTAEETAEKLRETQQQMRLLGPQITDIVTGLATGQSPFTVLLQQGGQLRDVFGGTGNALRALSSTFTAARVVFAATAGTLAAVAFQAMAGRVESDALNKSLAATGNIVGITAGQFNELAQRIASTQNASIGSVRETLQTVLDSGKFLGATMDSAARASTSLQKLTGQSADETLKQFSALTEDVGAGAVKLNQAYHFLTADQVDYVRSLESQGRSQQAIRFTLDELSKSIEQRHAPTVDLLSRSWTAFKNVLSGVLDSMKAIWRDETIDDRVAKLQATLKRLEFAEQRFGANPLRSAEIASTRAKLDAEVSQRNSDQLRTVDGALRQQEEEEKAQRRSKAFQDLLAQIDLAGAQKLLAQRVASLDAQRAATEGAYALGLTSAKDNALALNRIDQARLAAQEATLSRQIEIEKGRKNEKVGDEETKQARLLQLETQRIGLRSQLGQSRAKQREIEDEKSLDEAQQQARDYAQIWERAETQIQTFAQQLRESRAKLMADPIKRAEAEAEAATAAMRKEFDDLQRDLGNKIKTNDDHGQRAVLQRQLDILRAQAEPAIKEKDRAARFGSLTTQADEQQSQLAEREAAIQADVQAGLLTTAEGEERILKLRQDQLPAIERIATAMRGLATSPDQQAIGDKLAEQIRLQKQFEKEVATTARSSAISGLSSALTDIVTGAKSGKQALLDMVSSFAKAMLDVLNRRLAEQLVNQFISAGGAGSSSSGAFWSWGAWKLFHEGGLVGQAGGASRAVNPAAFALVPRYHSGGISGLMPDEVPAILRKGEEVLTADDPRHRNNAGSGGAVVSVGNVNVEVNAGAGVDGLAGRELGDRLSAAVRQTSEQWAIEQMRPGGMFQGLRNLR